MRVLSILTVYNDLYYLKFKVEWCKQNNLDIYIIDNMSNDGTWEWLQEQKIKSHKFDTNDSFDLRLLQDEIIKTIHQQKPDWVVYNGADLFFQTHPYLEEQIKRVDMKGGNLIEMDFISMFNTGEDFQKTPFETYFYYKFISKLVMIHRYDKDISYTADNVSLPNPKIIQIPGMIVNFGQTKNKQEREETLRRRQKAWDNGLKSNYGNHYRKGQRLNWVWNKDNLENIKSSKYWEYYIDLQTL